MQKEKIEINTEFITLSNLLKFAGLAETGGHSKEIVAEGVCFVNGQLCMQRGKKLRKGDKLVVDELELEII